MQINNCYEKVKKNCFKFIKSQETRTNKFKNKNKMLKSYLIPLCFWINKIFLFFETRIKNVIKSIAINNYTITFLCKFENLNLKK